MRKFPTKDEILSLMANGWELGQSTSIRHQRAWLQKGGIGKGGEAKNVHSATLQSLLNSKLVEGKYAFPSMKFRLTATPKGDCFNGPQAKRRTRS